EEDAEVEVRRCVLPLVVPAQEVRTGVPGNEWRLSEAGRLCRFGPTLDRRFEGWVMRHEAGDPARLGHRRGGELGRGDGENVRIEEEHVLRLERLPEALYRRPPVVMPGEQLGIEPAPLDAVIARPGDVAREVRLLLGADCDDDPAVAERATETAERRSHE